MALADTLFVVGKSGAGKSTVGPLLATELGRPFIDLDKEIERRAGASIKELLSFCEKSFRVIEEATLQKLVDERPGTVIAVGAGACESVTAQRLMRRNGLVVEVHVDNETAWQRIAGTRPLARGDDGRRRFEERERSRRIVRDELHNLRVAATTKNPMAIAEEIASRLSHSKTEGVRYVLPRSTRRSPRFRFVDSFQSALRQHLEETPRACIVVDSAVKERIAQVPEPLVIEGGEAAKSLDNLEKMAKCMVGRGCRHIVAVGGGAVLDAAGFCASIFHRGVAWTAVPTTLLSMVDSSSGGKTALNVDAKNQLGSFHTPDSIIIDLSMLNTLDERHWRAGLVEAAKLAGLAPHLVPFAPVADAAATLRRGLTSPSSVGDVVELCQIAKAAIVDDDPTDRGLRQALNFGHTIGHAVEATVDDVTRGEAVAFGLRAELLLSVDRAGLDEAYANRLGALLNEINARDVSASIDVAAVIDKLFTDKKGDGDKARFTLMSAPGCVHVGVALDDDEVAEAIARTRR